MVNVITITITAMRFPTSDATVSADEVPHIKAGGVSSASPEGRRIEAFDSSPPVGLGAGAANLRGAAGDAHPSPWFSQHHAVFAAVHASLVRQLYDVGQPAVAGYVSQYSSSVTPALHA